MDNHTSPWAFWIILAGAAFFLYMGLGGGSLFSKAGDLLAGTAAGAALAKAASTPPPDGQPAAEDEGAAAAAEGTAENLGEDAGAGGLLEDLAPLGG